MSDEMNAREENHGSTSALALARSIRETIVDGFVQSADRLATIANAVQQLAGSEAAAQSAIDGLLFAIHFAAAGAGFTLEQDADYPLLEKFLSFTGKGHGIGNPDCSYHHAALDGAHTYRITGNRGTAWLLDAEVATFTIADSRQVTTDSFTARRIDIPKGEDFELTLSREPRDGLWLKLPEAGPCFVILREYFYDWDSEVPARMMIERVGAIYPPPTINPVLMAERASALAQWLKSEYIVPNRMRILAKEPNTLETMGFDQAYLQNNHYMTGTLLCDAEHALIIEMPAPQALYWSIAIFDALGGALHPHMRQNSINGHQAKIDTDNIFRAVVAHRDPGVANWLDGAGRPLLLVMARVNGANVVPTAQVTKVPFGTLRDHLPSDTAFLDPAARQESLRRRLKSAYRRLMIDY